MKDTNHHHCGFFCTMHVDLSSNASVAAVMSPTVTMRLLVAGNSVFDEEQHSPVQSQ
jgi:hypothetical protein